VSCSAEQAYTLDIGREVVASIRAIVETDLLRAAVIIEAAVSEVKVKMAACMNICVGDDIPRETLWILLSDLLTLT
jgi:hypothetical protein